MSTEPATPYEATATRRAAEWCRSIARLRRIQGRTKEAEEGERTALQYEAQALELEREWGDA